MARSFGARFGARIRARREARGLTQAALAEAVGVSSNYLSVLERGHKLPTLDTLVRLAKALQVSPGDLLDGAGVRDEWVDEVLTVSAAIPRHRRGIALAVLRAVARAR